MFSKLVEQTNFKLGLLLPVLFPLRLQFLKLPLQAWKGLQSKSVSPSHASRFGKAWKAANCKFLEANRLAQTSLKEKMN